MASGGMISEILPGELYVGDFQDTKDHAKEYYSINVAYEHKDTLPDSHWLPFMTPVRLAPDPTTGMVPTVLNIDSVVLEALAEIIDLNLKAGQKVLVNCNMGIERSPLTCAWFLYRKRGMTFDAAYELVKKARPQAQDRRAWVQPFLGDTLN